MLTSHFCVTAVTRLLRPAALLLLLAVAACAVPRLDPAAPPKEALDSAAPPKDALAFDDAVDRLTVSLFARARYEPAGTGPRTLVIDPLIDRNTGNQAIATRSMERRMAEIVRSRFPAITPGPFNAQSLAARPLLLVGSITPVAAPGVIPTTSAPTQTYRVWAAVADLRTNRIISHETAWIRADGVDMTPTPFFQDSPAWLADGTKAAYIKTCAGNPGDPVDPSYLSGLQVAATLADGINAYEAGRYSDALALYASAAAQPSGDQLRSYNGLYLSYAKLGRGAEAEDAFGQAVEYGLRKGKLAVKFVFLPNTTRFWPDRQVSGQYPMWLRQIATRTAGQTACLRMAGHTSPTGSVPLNQALSDRRAQFIRMQLVSRSAMLAPRTDAVGRGSSEPLVGSGRDDATDVLDRRVEFEPRSCEMTTAMR